MPSCLLCRGSKIFAEHPDPAMRTLGPLNTRLWQCVCRPSCLILKSTPSTKAPSMSMHACEAFYKLLCIVCDHMCAVLRSGLQYESLPATALSQGLYSRAARRRQKFFLTAAPSRIAADISTYKQLSGISGRWHSHACTTNHHYSIQDEPTWAVMPHIC